MEFVFIHFSDKGCRGSTEYDCWDWKWLLYQAFGFDGGDYYICQLIKNQLFIASGQILITASIIVQPTTTMKEKKHGMWLLWIRLNYLTEGKCTRSDDDNDDIIS